MEQPDHPVTTWRKSTYSGGNGSNCLEVAATPDALLVRDSKNREGISLVFAVRAWTQFATMLKAKVSSTE